MGDIGTIRKRKYTLIPAEEPGGVPEKTPEPVEPVKAPGREKVPA